MQLCKCLDCFLKTHNKQINLYCLNFFSLPKKIVLKNGSSKCSGRGSSRVDPQKTQVKSRVNPFLLQVKKRGSGWVGSKNSNPFFHVLKEKKKNQQDFYKYVCLSLDESYE